MSLHSWLMAAFLAFSLSLNGASAQEAEPAPEPDRAATGGAQTLEDIMARQRGEAVDDSFRRDATGSPDTAAPSDAQLGTLGGVSDPELWRALRYGTADVTASNGSPAATVLVQDGGMAWLQFREGPLSKWGGYALLGMIVVLILFYLLRGRIRIEHGRTGITIERFKPIERFGHWLTAGSFVILGITGLITLFGRKLVDLGTSWGWDVATLKSVNATLAIGSKWLHNNVGWAFMLGLILIFVMWVVHNLPSRTDIGWILKGGGLFTKGVHPPAKKFNAGQKVIFWLTILLGASISASGLSLLFPFELPMFAKTFVILNDLGLPALIGLDPLPTMLSPHQEMQFAQAWHAIMAFVMMCVIIAHIYLGSVGMEGAYDAMGSGQVDVNWAKEHHSLWVEEVEARKGTAPAQSTPAE